MNRPRKSGEEEPPPIKGRVTIVTVEDEAAGAELFRAIRWAQERTRRRREEERTKKGKE